MQSYSQVIMAKYKDRILRLRDVIEISGFSQATLYRKERARLFPARVDLGGGSVGWSENSVNKWLESLVPTRDRRRDDE